MTQRSVDRNHAPLDFLAAGSLPPTGEEEARSNPLLPCISQTPAPGLLLWLRRKSREGSLGKEAQGLFTSINLYSALQQDNKTAAAAPTAAPAAAATASVSGLD